ncbi:MAG: undecaprenyl-diphosphate phosphatase [Thermogutta sp.]
MTEYVQIALLAVVQGLGEFLPISSSGHVMVLAHLCDQFGRPLPDKLAVNVILHFGTLLAILVYYRRRIFQILRDDWKTLGLLVVATLPAGIVGVVYELWLADLAERYLGVNPLEHPITAGLMFVATGGVLLSVRGRDGETFLRKLTLPQALLVGFAQAAAILPGLSRSGTTIAAGLACGLKREEAATFSFLLAVPTILGATLIEARKLFVGSDLDSSWGPMAVGLVLAFVVGLAALKWLIGWLKRGRLGWFVPWVFFMGTVVLAWQICLLF